MEASSLIAFQTNHLDGGGAVPAVTERVVYVNVTLTEPLLLSPTNMSFQMNMASDANRAWRSVTFPITDGVASEGRALVGPFTKTAVVHSVASSALTFTFLTGHATDRLPARNIVPYHELPICRTTGTVTLPPRVLT